MTRTSKRLPHCGELFVLPEDDKMIEALMSQPRLNAQMIQEANRKEIERAIDNVKRSDFDRWFRRQYYRAAAQRRKALRTPAQNEQRPWVRR